MFEIANPWILLALPAPFIVYRFFSRRKIKSAAALRVPFYQDVTQIPQTAQTSSKNFFHGLWFLFLVWCLFVFAASGPQLVGKPMELKRSGRDIMLAIDISASMETPDMQINHQQVDRLAAIQSIARGFIKDREGDRLGLILFGTHAYLLTPMTYDHDTLTSMLNDASIGLAGPQTAIGDAIGLAIKRLIEYPKEDRILVLLTDGVNNAGQVSALSAANMAAKYHIKIYTIGFGAERAVVESFMGPQVVNPSADLDETTLKKIADITHGLYFRAKDTKALQKVYDTLNQVEPLAKNQGVYRPLTPLYPWPLGLGLLLSAGLFSWPLLRNYFKRGAL